MNKILIVDDEIELCELLRAYLSKKDYDVDVAYTLNDGKQQVSTNTYDLIFMDNNLPDGMGWEYAPEIVEQHPHTYIAHISAYPPTEIKMPANGRYSVLIKPLKFSKIAEVLKDAFG